MTGTVKLPDLDTLARLRRRHAHDESHPGNCRAGHTLKEIAAMYDVTEQGVYVKFMRAGRTDPRNRYAEAIPWRVTREHDQHYDLNMLRELAKRDQGLPLGQRGGRLDDWLQELDQHPRQVIAYDREEGFSRVRRRATDGDGYIRRPKSTPRKSRTRMATS